MGSRFPPPHYRTDHIICQLQGNLMNRARCYTHSTPRRMQDAAHTPVAIASLRHRDCTWPIDRPRNVADQLSVGPDSLDHCSMLPRMVSQCWKRDEASCPARRTIFPDRPAIRSRVRRRNPTGPASTYRLRPVYETPSERVLPLQSRYTYHSSGRPAGGRAIGVTTTAGRTVRRGSAVYPLLVLLIRVSA